MKNISKKIQWLSGLVVLLIAGQVQSAVVMSGSAFFEETTVGAGMPYFSGTLFGEVSGTAGNYTSTFWIDFDNGPNPLTLADITLNAFQLGAAAFGNPGPTSGGSTGGDPIFSSSCNVLGCDAKFSFGGGGLSQGSTSSNFWFTHPELDTTGESISFFITTFLDSGGTSSESANLVLTAVPLPAAIWLFCSGLLGLAHIVRHRERT